MINSPRSSASGLGSACPGFLKRHRELAGRLFDKMLAAAGPRHWWPRDPNPPDAGRDEIIIGAVLTQNTAWKNVEQALANLKTHNVCRLADLARTPPERIAPIIRPAGYFNLKARRLRAVAEFFAPGGRPRFDEIAAWDDARLRSELLTVWGVGPETADSILLYALGRLSFVVDAYTLRIGRRHGLFDDRTDYEQARAWFMRRVAPDLQRFNEYHALLVWIGNNFCKPTPRCRDCPLAARVCFASEGAWRKLAPYRAPKTRPSTPRKAPPRS